MSLNQTARLPVKKARLLILFFLRSFYPDFAAS